MKTKLLKLTQVIVLVFASAIFLFTGCTKNNIIIDIGDEGKPSGGNNPGGSCLVTFHATVEGRNLLTRAMSPMDKGIQSRLYAYVPTPQDKASGTPSAEGLYVTSSPGVLSGSDGYKMYLSSGMYDFYAVSDNFSTIPPKFTNGKSEPLFNGIDYLWWHSPNLDVLSSQISIPILYLHAATQVVVEVEGGDGIKVNKLLFAMITPPLPGASMDLATGYIPPVSTFDRADKMGVNGSLAQYIMLPLETTEPMSMSMDILVNDETTPRTYTVVVPVPDGALKAGNSYLFEAIINENTITFSGVNIKNWTEVDETGKPVYPTLKK